MPLYDCMLLLKPHVRKEASMELVSRVGKHVYTKNGVVADMKSFGTVQLGYGIKKLDGKYYQAQLMQMTMMAPPSINSEMLRYLNKEDRLLRWLLVKHRDIKYGLEFLSEDDAKNELNRFKSNLYDYDNTDEDEDDEDEDDEYQPETKHA
ncbi:30S ribosomal S6-like [Olea europaea subsp. europaea]|uniref:30S ribosomal S6-like n=1 Tax=Olea europaea subsp. europaea TaxID=158383 RepID=A0A8S0RZ72_OLEEU|nr:30S ribosomal S6-like [Olea europaea subsp. europaea]